MCGIAGLVKLNGQAIESSLIKKMTSAVAHRGPDGEGFLVEKNVAFGHRRLAIVDLSADGIQPMSSTGSKSTIVFNGEIYNYLELREELKALGHIFLTATDTEVLLASYAEWGPSCVQRLNGMWSFAIYDRMRGHIFCSRDRFGEKPFYYVHNSIWFGFGSEIRQLLPFLNGRHANSTVLHKFIVGGQAEDLTQTFFDGVNKLPGGHNLTFDLHTKEINIERFYELKIDTSLAHISIDEAVARFSDLIDDSIRLRMRADVAVGTCLSGGLDSSSVATLASRQYWSDTNKSFSAITASSEQGDNDESEYAQRVVDHNKMTWYKVRPNYDDFSAALPCIVEAQEEPFPSASIAMQYFVMQCAREHSIPVLLDGQGGDEILLGYERYFAAHYLSEIRNAGLLRTLASMRRSGTNNANLSVSRVLGYFIYFNSPNIRWLNYRHRHSYLRHFPEMFEEVRMYADVGGDIHALQKLEIERTNLPALLRYEDKNAMRFGIETRLPFLDYRLVELGLSLPGSCKISDGWTKQVLRKSMNGRMPNSITWRQNKFGFEAPERLWFSRHQKTMLEGVRNSALLASISNHDKLVSKFTMLDSLTQWRLYSVSCWEHSFDVNP